MGGVSVGKGGDPQGLRVWGGGATWGHSWRVAICAPRREASGETDPADTLALDLLPPEPVENTFPLLTAPGLRDLSKATEPADVEADSLPDVSITQHETDVVSWSLF